MSAREIAATLTKAQREAVVFRCRKHGLCRLHAGHKGHCDTRLPLRHGRAILQEQADEPA